tara:strand:- start:204 stop:590 length:387 start_codon:yes stop_codon:yes gene_type:complete
MLKRTRNPLIYLCILVLILFSNGNLKAYGTNNKWVEVSKTSAGIQYLDIDSLDNKEQGIIEIKTKYLRIDPYSSKTIEENIYIMKIDCIDNKYKDISVNGKKNITAKWEDPKKDKLLNDVILDSCKNV